MLIPRSPPIEWSFRRRWWAVAVAVAAIFGAAFVSDGYYWLTGDDVGDEYVFFGASALCGCLLAWGWGWPAMRYWATGREE